MRRLRRLPATVFIRAKTAALNALAAFQLLAQAFPGRFPTAQGVSGTLPYWFTDSLTGPAIRKSRFKPHRLIRLSSMKSIGSAHADRFCALRLFAREHSR